MGEENGRSCTNANKGLNGSTRLICTTPEFGALAKQVCLKSHKQGATDPTERANLRAELDGLIAHLYGLT